MVKLFRDSRVFFMAYLQIRELDELSFYTCVVKKRKLSSGKSQRYTTHLNMPGSFFFFIYFFIKKKKETEHLNFGLKSD